MTQLKKTVLFLTVPLLLELLAYLYRANVYPGYLPFFTRWWIMLVAFFYFAVLFIAASVVVGGIFKFLRLQPQHMLPPAFFGLYLALIASRLLPQDSGFSLHRILALSTSSLLAAGAYVLIKRKQFPESRLFIASSLFCLIAAISLAHLFRFPFLNPGMALFLLTFLFASLLFLSPKPLALLLGVLILLSSYPYSRFSPKAPSTPQSAYQRVILIGIDGLSPEITFSLAREGKLPAFLQVMKEGVSGTIQTLDVPFSPLVWNTIYTGTTPQQHGIMSFTLNGVAGAPSFLSLWFDCWSNSDWMHQSVNLLHRGRLLQTLPPALSIQRQEPAVWNMVDQNGFQSIVVGGWTTYPPEMIRGTYVSDFALISEKSPKDGYYPQNAAIDQLLSQKIGTAAWPREIQKYVAKDERANRLSRALFTSPDSKIRFLTVYFCSVDAFGHHYGTHIDMKSTNESERSRLLQDRENIYRKMDAYLQDYLSMVDDHTLLLLCSDHGFFYDKRQHNYPVDGTILLYGKGVAGKTTLQTNMYAIAPTILYALGLSPASEFQGKPLHEAFQGRIAEPPARKYQKNTSFLEIRSREFEREKMEELIDLQYINR